MTFLEQARALGFDLTQAQARAFERYRDAVIGAAARFNLTAVRDPEGIERRHFLESLALGRRLVDAGALPPDGDCQALDLGTGAGFPGLPLKIAWPRLRLSLLDSNEKRCEFLRGLVAELRLSDVEVLVGRAETWGRDQAHREAYDLVLARAVAPLMVLVEYALPFLSVGGWLAASKGTAGSRELDEAALAITELGGGEVTTLPMTPPLTLVLVRKTGPTPERYPRRVGVPAKRPLA